MAEHTQLIDAINIRTAVRAYDDEPIDDDTARQLEMALQPINLLGDLNIQLVRDQPKVFAEAIGITGVVLSKLDGSAKGGIVVSVQKELGVPVKLVGLGEGPDDLAPFDPEGFVDGILA